MSIKKKITYALDSVASESTATIKIDVKKDGSVISTKDYNMTIRPAKADKYNKWVVFAVAGQSNSVGYDESENTTLLNPNSDPDRIKQVGYYGEDNLKIIPLQSMAQNLQNMINQGVSANTKGTKGLHLPLAELIAKHIPDDYGVLVVPVAYGMTFFTRSSGTTRTYNTTKMQPDPEATNASNGPGNDFWTVNSAYHQTLRDRVKWALDQGAGKTVNKFAGVIWCQGEADTAQFGGTSSNHGALFQALVSQLATDWADYNQCSPTGTMDKSVWFVHDTTQYWRQRSNKTSEGVDVSNIWAQYQKYLDLGHVVNILPLEEYTNAVNGGGTRTSSTYNSHYGNNAYRDIIAPRVMDALLKFNMIHGQAVGARNATTFEKVITKVSCRSQGLDIKENGEVNWAISVLNNATLTTGNTCGWAAMIFDEDIKEVKITNMQPNLLLVYRTELETFRYQSLLFADSNQYGSKTTSYNRFWLLHSGTSKDLNYEIGWESIVKDGYTFDQTINRLSETDIITLSIDEATNGVKVMLNDTVLLDKANDIVVDVTKPRLGFIYGWTTGSSISETLCRILSVTKKDGTVIESAYSLSQYSLSFTTADPQTITVNTTGTISNLNKSSSIIDVALNDKTITVTPTDSGEANVTFDITLDNGSKETLTVPVTVSDDPFYTYVKIYGDAVAANSTVSVQTTKPKCILLKAGADVPFVIKTNDEDWATNLTIKDYETAVAPYATINISGKTVRFVSAPPSAPLEVTWLYKETELTDKMYLSTGVGNATETNISYKIKK